MTNHDDLPGTYEDREIEELEETYSLDDNEDISCEILIDENCSDSSVYKEQKQYQYESYVNHSAFDTENTERSTRSDKNANKFDPETDYYLRKIIRKRAMDLGIDEEDLPEKPVDIPKDKSDALSEAVPDYVEINEEEEESEEAEQDPIKIRDQKDKKLNNHLVTLVIILLIVLVGENYIIRNGENEIYYYTNTVNEVQPNKSISESSLPGATEVSTAPAANNLININTADIDELIQLSGIGEKKASAIIEYRKVYGAFSDIEEILNVSGIGQATFEKIKNYITV